MRRALILDCDPGHDDALAIALAGRHTELLGITTVAGNVPLPLTTRNALIMTDVLSLDVPVHAGCDRPMVAPLRTAEFIHGVSGMDGPELPEPRRPAASTDAVGFIVDTVRARPGEVWIAAVGPLTNVAVALQQAPDLAGSLAGISIMGGGLDHGNVTPAAEFNILVDPEAADLVFRSGVRLVMAGLDLTHQWRLGPPEADRIRAGGGRASAFCADLITSFSQAYARVEGGPPAGPLHDPCAVLALSHPQLFEHRDYHVVVELDGQHTRGMTLADRRGVRSGAEPNTQVLTRIDAAAATELLIETLHTYG